MNQTSLFFVPVILFILLTFLIDTFTFLYNSVTFPLLFKAELGTIILLLGKSPPCHHAEP